MTTAPDREQFAIALARKTARRWYDRGNTVENGDILGAAFLGAMKALGRFDPAQGVAFSTYAIALIRAEIREELRIWDPLSRPFREKAREEEEATGELPRWAWPYASLADVVYGGEAEEEGSRDIPREDTLVDPDQDTEAEALVAVTRAEWRRLIDWLPERERRVILGYFYEGRMLRDLSDEMGRTDTVADLLKARGLGRLRAWAEEGLVSL